MKGRSALFLLLAVVFQCLGPLAVFVPRALPLVLGILSIAGIAIEWRNGNLRAVFRLNGIQISLFLLFALALASSLWSLDGGLTLTRAGRLGLFLLPILALPRMARRVTDGEKDILWPIFAGSWAGAVLLMVEEHFMGHPIFHMGKGLAFDAPLEDSVTNQPLIILGLLLWPVAIHYFSKGPKWNGLLFPLAATALLLPLTSQSAALAMAVATLALVVGFVSARAMRRLWLAISLMGCVAVVPIAMLPWRWGWANCGWLMDSARHRVEIWYFSAVAVLQRPFLGHGLETSSLLRSDDGNWRFLGKSIQVMDHPHNLFLQVWLELGFAGAFLMLLFFIALYRNLRRMDLVRQPHVWAALFFVVTAASAGFGAWQSWWLAAICFMALLLMMEKEHGKQT